MNQIWLYSRKLFVDFKTYFNTMKL